MKIFVNRVFLSVSIGLAILASAASADGFKFGRSGGSKSSGNSSFSKSSGKQRSGGNSSFQLSFGKFGKSSENKGIQGYNSTSSNSKSQLGKKKDVGLSHILGNNKYNKYFNNQLNKHDKHRHGQYINGKYCDDAYRRNCVRVYCVQPVNDCYYPYFSSCSVYPGDTYNSLSLRAYGMSSFGRQIASYNRLGTNNSALIPGKTLQFPVVHPDGRLTKSNAPAHVPFATYNEVLGATNTRLGATNTQLGKPAPAVTAPVDANIPSVAVGSTLLIEGQSFGTEKGTAKLRIGNVAFPVEVVEWTANAAKLQLPRLDVSGPTAVELELSLADGTLASKSPIKLTPITTQVATR